jgi:hypothetical protein
MNFKVMERNRQCHTQEEKILKNYLFGKKKEKRKSFKIPICSSVTAYIV